MTSKGRGRVGMVDWPIFPSKWPNNYIFVFDDWSRGPQIKNGNWFYGSGEGVAFSEKKLLEIFLTRNKTVQ